MRVAAGFPLEKGSGCLDCRQHLEAGQVAESGLTRRTAGFSLNVALPL